MNPKAKQLLIRIGITSLFPAIGLIIVLAFPDFFNPTGSQRQKLSGAEIYQLHCGNCHGENGEGLRGLYPPLAGSDYLKKSQSQLPCIIRYGLKGPIVVNGREYNLAMAGQKLAPGEVTQIINYINTSWGNDLPTWKYEKVRSTMERCAVRD